MKSRMRIFRCRLYGVCIAAFLISAPFAAQARTLAEIKARGSISMCANPDALPYASEKAKPPGFQIEMGQAIAAGLGVALETQWIVPRRKASAANCDILFDRINDPAIYEGRLLLSHPYQRTGTALALARNSDGINTFGDLKKGQKIGVMINSMASVVLGKRGVSVSPYAFEQDMLEDVINGELFGAAASPATASWFVQKHPEAGLRVVNAFEGEPELAWTVAIGMRKADEALVAAINQTLDRMLADGTVKSIYANYGLDERQP